MVPVFEVTFVLLCAGIGVRWYLRTPIHRARKQSGVQPPQVAGHGGFGMYTPSNPPTLPRGLHRHRGRSEDEQAPEDTSGSR